jgi:hypothetical protein
MGGLRNGFAKVDTVHGPPQTETFVDVILTRGEYRLRAFIERDKNDYYLSNIFIYIEKKITS